MGDGAASLTAHQAGGLDLNPWLSLAVGVVLVLVNGFFVAVEFALVKVRPTQLDPHVARGLRRARAARHMLDHLDSYLSATQLGITLASLGLGWVGEPAFAWLVRPLVSLFGASPAVVSTISIALAFLVITTLHIVIGEQAPKSFAIRKAEGTMLFTALPLLAFYKLTYPVIWLLNHSANRILRLIGVRPVVEGELGHNEEELRLLLASAGPARLSKQKRELLDNIFELSDRMARQIMLPRADVVYLSTTKSLEENLAIARESGHTRFPLCDGDLDHAVGLVHIKDLFRQGVTLTSLSQVARELAFVPETLQLDRLLRRMRAERLHMAAVFDEYGGVSGIVTMENVIEEIVGSIQDEFDLEKPELVKRGKNVYLVSGSMLVDDLEGAIGLELSDRDEDTIGGVVLSELGRPPVLGDRVVLGPVALEVLDLEGARIKIVRLTVAEPAPAEA